jgi:hypothetical protein
VAIGKKTGGRDVKVGQVLNPRGAGAHDPIVKRIRKLSQEELHEVGSMLLHRKFTDIEKLAENEDANGLKRVLASVILSAERGGNMAKFNALLDRLIGKVSDRVDITVKSPHANKSREQIEAEIKELQELDAIKAAKE